MIPQININVHGTTILAAIARSVIGPNGTFGTLTLTTGGGEVVVFLSDAAYAQRLADAINAAAPQATKEAA